MSLRQSRAKFARRHVVLYVVNVSLRVILPGQHAAIGHVNQRIHHGYEVVSAPQWLTPVGKHAGIPRASDQREPRQILLAEDGSDTFGHSEINEMQNRDPFLVHSSLGEIQLRGARKQEVVGFDVAVQHAAAMN